jgi:protein phosphatase
MTEPRRIPIPALSLVVLIGTSSSGKSTFAAKHFLPSEVVSSDVCRGMVDDDSNSLEATDDAFDLLHYLIGKRLKRGRRTVVDATNLRPEDRAKLVSVARAWHCLPVAIVLDPPRKIIEERHDARFDRDFSHQVLRRQLSTLNRFGRNLKREGFANVHRLRSVEDIEAAELFAQPMWNDKREDHGPFDIIGDVHGCLDELCALIEKLGYKSDADGYRHPDGRRLLFLGDLIDRGPKNLAVLDLVVDLVADGVALCVPGNHDVKFLKWLDGRKVQLKHGLDLTVAEVEALDPEQRSQRTEAWRAFLDGLISHLVLDDGRLVVAHAGMKEAYQGRGSGVVRSFALYGDTDGETDGYGLPIRYDWAADYRGSATVVYGHTPVEQAEWLNNTICIDTGCVFGGALTALRYPERELVREPARRAYAESVRPLAAGGGDAGYSAQQVHDDLLALGDVSGKRQVTTRLWRGIGISAEHSAAALEVMSRFAVHPKWLVYLPPTMSPCATHPEGDLLEHPAEALGYYRDEGIQQVICEQKHMGSRAVVIVCRDAEVARRRFGVSDGLRGVIISRTGRRFFDDLSVEQALLSRLDTALEKCGLYAELATDFVVLDAELMPWSVKAQELLRQQYAAVGAAVDAESTRLAELIGHAVERGLDPGKLSERSLDMQDAAQRFRTAYRQYCWSVSGVDDLRLAPFHILAGASGVYTDRNHQWHMDQMARLAAVDELFIATPYQLVDLADEAACKAVTSWWQQLTDAGGEGMVVKPLDFIATGKRGLVQPAVKCRGPEYLRIIYGPEYRLPANIDRLRQRGLGRKRSLALREFALGMESLERFARAEPLRRVHECVFAVLALECEPVDPRL